MLSCECMCIIDCWLQQWKC